jgi:glycosyltransferase involved in cell wall biosynthesis
MTDPLGQSQVIPYLAGLSKKGHRIFLLSFEKKSRFEKLYPNIRTLLSENKIEWTPLSYTASPAVLSTLWDVRQAKKTAKKIIKKNSIQLIHCRSYIAALVGLSFKRKKNIPFIFDMRGFWADERVEGGLWKLKNPLYKKIYHYFKNKEKQFFIESGHIISLTENGKKEILSMSLTGVDEKKITVIPCCADTQIFRPLLLDVSLRKLQMEMQIDKDATVVSYLGSFGTWYMANEMFDFFSRFLIPYPDAVFLIISQDDPAPMIELAKIKGIPANSLRIKAAERNDVPLLLALSKATLFFIQPSFSKKASSPTKMGEALCMGIPVICNDGIGDNTSIIKATYSGIIVSDFSITAYDNAIKQFESVCNTDRNIIRQNVLKYFDLNIGIERYQSVYESQGTT